MDNVLELTYGELHKLLEEKMSENPSMKDEKALIMIGKLNATYRVSSVKSIEAVDNGRDTRIVIKGAYYNGKPT